MKSLLETIERHLPEGGTWCDMEKATALAAMVISLRPTITLEIGVWQGGSAIPLALAIKYNRESDPQGAARRRDGILIAIDPWDAKASVANEEQANVAWWGAQDHNLAFKKFTDRIARHELQSIVQVIRKRSDDATPPTTIDLLHVDGSHTEQAVRDVQRFGRNVRIGGIMVLDDLDWSGGGVQRAHILALQMGFVDMYKLGTGMVMQRTDPCDESVYARD